MVLKNRLAPTAHPTTTDIYWAAGFWEGEGYCAPSAISASQKDPYVLHKLQALFGGSVGRRKNGKYDPVFTWNLCGARARGLAMTLYPFLSPRRREQLRKGGLVGPFRLSAE